MLTKADIKSCLVADRLCDGLGVCAKLVGLGWAAGGSARPQARGLEFAVR